MAKKKSGLGISGARAQSPRSQEWIGAQAVAPFYVHESRERPLVSIWLEAGTMKVVGTSVDPATDLDAFPRSLAQALDRPMTGRARTPHRIRVATPQLAVKVREVMGPYFPVEIAPTPETDAMLETMFEDLGEPDEDDSDRRGFSFLDERVPRETVVRFFEAAQRLYRQAPWELVADTQVFRFDAPILGLEGGCVSVIGQQKQSFGMLLFPSKLAFERHLAHAMVQQGDPAPEHLGTHLLALNFLRRAEVPEPVLKEVSSACWPVASPDAYPIPMAMDEDVVPRPLDPGDYQRLTACAEALAALFESHSQTIAKGERAVVTTRVEGVQVQAGVPYEGTLPLAVPAQLDALEVSRLSVDLDRRLVESMLAFGAQKHRAATQRVLEFAHRTEEDIVLSLPWALYVPSNRGKTLAQAFVEKSGASLSELERDWIRAKQEGWHSLWEIEDAVPGESLALHDLLTGERRRVLERMGSQNVQRNLVLFASVIRFRGVDLLTASDPRLLPPLEANTLATAAAEALGPLGKIPAAKLRKDKAARRLYDLWHQAVEARNQRAGQPLALQNTEGDPLLFTRDLFEFDATREEAIAAIVRKLPGVEAESPGRFVRLLPGSDTLCATLELQSGRLSVESNSQRRADETRDLLQAACGPLLEHRGRSHTDPLSERGPGPSPTGRTQVPPEVQAAIKNLREQHVRRWVDEAVPALGGLTPRKAAQDRSTRGRVEALVKEMELMEARLPEPERLDLSWLRRELKLG